MIAGESLGEFQAIVFWLSAEVVIGVVADGADALVFWEVGDVDVRA